MTDQPTRYFRVMQYPSHDATEGQLVIGEWQTTLTDDRLRATTLEELTFSKLVVSDKLTDPSSLRITIEIRHETGLRAEHSPPIWRSIAEYNPQTGTWIPVD